MIEKDKSEEKLKEFWRDIVYNPDGTLNETAILNELADYKFILDQVPIVYTHITGGFLSKLMYDARTVIQEHDRIFEEKEITKSDVKDIIKHSATLDDLEKELKEYFDL